ncbi:MAG: hypothetical protein J5772_08735 [Clostridia bacterium]|nr:hypothetical protein [Clostridia bacterium]
MKKLACFVLAVLMLLSLAACGGKDKPAEPTAAPMDTGQSEDTAEPTLDPALAVFDPETDFDNRFGMNYDRLAETADAYYFSANESSYLYYYDKASGERGVLCPRPECMHDEGRGDANCSGLLHKTCATFNMWDGRLHYYGPESGQFSALYSMALDGSGRTKDVEIEETGALAGITPQRLDYHRGKLYGYDLKSIVKDGEPYWGMYIFSIDAETGEFREIVTVLSKDDLTQPYLYYRTNSVYISYEEYVYNEQENSIEDFFWHVLRWDIYTEQLEEVAAVDGETLDDPAHAIERRIYIDDDGRIWSAPMRNNLEGPHRVSVIENGVFSDAFRFETTGACFLIENAAVTIFMSEHRWEVRRLDGTLIYMGELDTSFLDDLIEGRTYKSDAIWSIMGNADEIFISLGLESTDGSDHRICLVRYDMTGEMPVPTIIALAKENY